MQIKRVDGVNIIIEDLDLDGNILKSNISQNPKNLNDGIYVYRQDIRQMKINSMNDFRNFMEKHKLLLDKLRKEADNKNIDFFIIDSQDNRRELKHTKADTKTLGREGNFMESLCFDASFTNAKVSGNNGMYDKTLAFTQYGKVYCGKYSNIEDIFNKHNTYFPVQQEIFKEAFYDKTNNFDNNLINMIVRLADKGMRQSNKLTKYRKKYGFTFDMNNLPQAEKDHLIEGFDFFEKYNMIVNISGYTITFIRFKKFNEACQTANINFNSPIIDPEDKLR